MYYTRGSAEDFNRYGELTGDPGWSWDSVLPYFFKVRLKKIKYSSFLTLQ